MLELSKCSFLNCTIHMTRLSLFSMFSLNMTNMAVIKFWGKCSNSNSFRISIVLNPHFEADLEVIHLWIIISCTSVSMEIRAPRAKQCWRAGQDTSIHFKNYTLVELLTLGVKTMLLGGYRLSSCTKNRTWSCLPRQHNAVWEVLNWKQWLWQECITCEGQ